MSLCKPLLLRYGIFLVAHLLQVTSLEGLFGEVVPLLSVIPASPRPQGWLATLEEKMRNTLSRSLAECVKRRLTNKESVLKLVELLSTLGEKTKVPSHCSERLESSWREIGI